MDSISLTFNSYEQRPLMFCYHITIRYYIIVIVIICGIFMVRDKCGQQMGEYMSQIFICLKSFLHMYLLFEFLEATVII